MSPNRYLVPQPGSIIKSDSEAIVRESPRSIFSRKKSLAEYRNRPLPQAESIFNDQESIQGVDGPFISNQVLDVATPARARSDLKSKIKVASK
jgi:hypothetical protein